MMVWLVWRWVLLVSSRCLHDLSVFVLSSELQRSLCCSLVARGLKFFTLGATYSTHVKKTTLYEDHMYIVSHKKVAYLHHHFPKNLLTLDQLGQIL